MLAQSSTCETKNKPVLRKEPAAFPAKCRDVYDIRRNKKRADKFDKRFDKRDREINQLIADHHKPGELAKEHLDKCGDDLILITLKGHLIIEHLLEMNLCRLLGIDRLPKEKEDNYPELEFIHKLKLLQAVTVGSKPGPNTDLFKAIAKLNKIRNRLVHNLKNAKEIEADIKSVIDCYQSKADKKLSLGEPLPAQLKSCIYKLCRFLDSVNVHFHRLKWDSYRPKAKRLSIALI